MLGNTFSLKKQLLMFSSSLEQRFQSIIFKRSIKNKTSHFKTPPIQISSKKNQQLSLITDATKEIKTSRRIFESKFFFYFAIFFSCFFRNFRPKQFSRNTEPIFFRTEPECTRNRNSEISRCTEKLFFRGWLTISPGDTGSGSRIERRLLKKVRNKIVRKVTTP